jgi:hypothetical protein
MHVPVWSTWPCTMCPSRRSPNFMASLGSSCHQLPSFQDSFFERFRQLRLLNRSCLSVRPRSNKFHCGNALVYFKFSCNWRVYCNVNIAFVVLISWMVPRVSMIPVNISYFILLNLHFKISNKYTELMMKKSRKYNSWNFNRFKRYWKRVVLKTFEDLVC